MADTATEAAVAGATAPVAETEAIETPVIETPATEVAPVKKPISEVVRMAREKRRLEARIAELESRGNASDGQTGSRNAIIAALKAKYESDPEEFLSEVGVDFYDLAQRLAKKGEPVEETVASLAAKQDAIDKRLKTEDDRRKTEEQKTAAAATAKHLESIAGVMRTELGEDGGLKYPTLATLDPETGEDPALTAYDAVTYAWVHECCKLDAKGAPIVGSDGKYVVIRQWPEDETLRRFHGAFAKLDEHYAKFRTPKGPSIPVTPEPDLSPTISNQHSSGTAQRPQKAGDGTMRWQDALRLALKEQGLS